MLNRLYNCSTKQYCLKERFQFKESGNLDKIVQKYDYALWWRPFDSAWERNEGRLFFFFWLCFYSFIFLYRLWKIGNKRNIFNYLHDDINKISQNWRSTSCKSKTLAISLYWIIQNSFTEQSLLLSTEIYKISINNLSDK